MFSKSARYYDEIYAAIDKDYAAEAEKVGRLIREHSGTDGRSLLDVACGTGEHAGHLSRQYDVQGLDLDPAMLRVARQKHPGIRFHRGDMADFDLGRGFDAVVCLFSSIGYVRTKARLRRAVRNMARHLLPGGVLVVEPWFSPESWHPGRVNLLPVEQPDLKIVRMSHSGQKGRVSLLSFHYLIGTPEGIEHRFELHEMGLFTHAEYLDAFRAARLDVRYDEEGLTGRGLYIGVKPSEQR